MAISSVLTTATSGLRAASLRAESAAGNIANINTKGYHATLVSQSTLVNADPVDPATAVFAQLQGSDNPPDLTNEIVRLIEAEATYRANAEVIRTAEDVAKQTVNLRA